MATQHGTAPGPASQGGQETLKHNPRGRDTAQSSGTSLGHRDSWGLATDCTQGCAWIHPHPLLLQMSLLKSCKQHVQGTTRLLKMQEFHGHVARTPGQAGSSGQWRAGLPTGWFPKRVQDTWIMALKELGSSLTQNSQLWDIPHSPQAAGLQGKHGWERIPSK